MSFVYTLLFIFAISVEEIIIVCTHTLCIPLDITGAAGGGRVCQCSSCHTKNTIS